MVYFWYVMPHFSIAFFYCQLKLIESFTSVLEGAGVMCADGDDDGDFLVKLAKLVRMYLSR